MIGSAGVGPATKDWPVQKEGWEPAVREGYAGYGIRGMNDWIEECRVWNDGTIESSVIPTHTNMMLSFLEMII